MTTMTTTSHCAECKQLATETTRERGTHAIVARKFPNGPVIRIPNHNATIRITVHVACREAFLKRVNEMEPEKEIA